MPVNSISRVFGTPFARLEDDSDVDVGEAVRHSWEAVPAYNFSDFNVPLAVG
jgi:hypothetical protein